MRFPKWAPAELIELYKELKPKADAEETRRKEFLSQKHPEVDWKTYLESGEKLHTGTLFLGDIAQFRILRAMITKPIMEDVWKNVLKRQYQHVRSLHGGKTQVRNLYGAAVNAEMRWLNVPRRTRAESAKLHEDVAAAALKLCELLIEAPQSRDLHDTRRFIDNEKFKAFMKELEEDGHELWYGIDGYFDYLLSEMLPPVPRILLDIQKRALEHAKYPHAVSQPNAPNAKLNFFIDELSEYFKKAYGQPLHAHVAAIVSAIFDEDVDEDRVRALIRSRNVASKAWARKEMKRMLKDIDG